MECREYTRDSVAYCPKPGRYEGIVGITALSPDPNT